MALYETFETTALNKPDHKKSWRRAGGCPEDPIADTIVAAFDVVFSAACEAAITAVGVFTEEACDEAIEKNLGLSC